MGDQAQGLKQLPFPGEFIQGFFHCHIPQFKPEGTFGKFSLPQPEHMWKFYPFIST